MHVPHQGAGKPEVSFKAPTYFIGGSDYSLTRQGGLILRIIMTALFFVENINKKIEDLVLCLFSIMHTTLQGSQKNRDFSEEFSRFTQVGIPRNILALTN